MLAQEIRELAAEWAGLGEYYRQPLSDQVCGWYAQDLSDLDFETVIAAMRRARFEKGRRQLPMPADVRERAKPAGLVGTNAVDLAAAISSGVARFGYTGTERAKAHIGDVGWGVVERMGGWAHLCMSLKTSEMGTFYAQCRELCRVAIDEAEAKAIALVGHEDTRKLRHGGLTALPPPC